VLTNPKIGQEVQVWYRAGVRLVAPLHGKVGRVAERGRGRPRNHAVKIDGLTFIVPCGNLRNVPPGRKPKGGMGDERIC